MHRVSAIESISGLPPLEFGDSFDRPSDCFSSHWHSSRFADSFSAATAGPASLHSRRPLTGRSRLPTRWRKLRHRPRQSSTEMVRSKLRSSIHRCALVRFSMRLAFCASLFVFMLALARHRVSDLAAMTSRDALRRSQSAPANFSTAEILYSAGLRAHTHSHRALRPVNLGSVPTQVKRCLERVVRSHAGQPDATASQEQRPRALRISQRVLDPSTS